MEFKFRANEQSSKPNPASSSIGYSTEQALRALYASTNSERPNELFRNPSIVREAIQRELEKERIREQIIEAEKRVIEAEIIRDFLIEKEMLLMSGGSSSSRSFLHEFEGRSGSKTLPFQRNAEPKSSEGKPLKEVGEEDIIYLAKPDADLSGAKRKAVTPLAAASNELPLVSLNKKQKDKWSCGVCHVSATCERGLNEHFQGKKHKAKEAGLRAERTGKNFSIGLFPHTTGKPTNLIDTSPCLEQEEELEGKIEIMGEEPLLKISNVEDMKKNNGLTLQIKQDADDLMKTDEEAAEKTRRTDYKKKRYKFWCEMCRIGAYTQRVMKSHKKGRKHLGRLEELNRNGGSIPVYQVAETTQKAKYVDVVAKDEGKEALENVDGTAVGTELENHPAVVEDVFAKDEWFEAMENVDGTADGMELENHPAVVQDVVPKDEGKEAMENVDGTADGTELENHPAVVEEAASDYPYLPPSLPPGVNID